MTDLIEYYVFIESKKGGSALFRQGNKIFLSFFVNETKRCGQKQVGIMNKQGKIILSKGYNEYKKYCQDSMQTI